MKRKIIPLLFLMIAATLISTNILTAENIKGAGSDKIDFGNRAERNFGDFHIDLPPSWTLNEVRDISYAGRELSGKMGGKNFSADITIEFHSAADQKTVDHLVSSYGKDIISGNTRFFFLRSEGYEDSTHNAKFFYHLFEDRVQSGFSVTGVLSSKNGSRLAVVKLVVTFAKGNSEAQDATSYLKKSSDIVRSFRIEGL